MENYTRHEFTFNNYSTIRYNNKVKNPQLEIFYSLETLSYDLKAMKPYNIIMTFITLTAANGRLD